jgi:hypothetical protein
MTSSLRYIQIDNHELRCRSIYDQDSYKPRVMVLADWKTILQSKTTG